ncbi:type II toxin-antitoxin system prevent-host-death family antitoxin [Acaryochloris marina NIES-2412]|uniref:type II toxin-antitoxin system prevent-host-death family antitoxin n=1 Tax=Acaryochloris marina TaxID=155978 RepID=UPI0040584E6D
MKVYTYSEARQNLSELLNQAQTEEVIIKRRDGAVFSVKTKKPKRSPFDVEGIESNVSKKQILAVV